MRKTAFDATRPAVQRTRTSPWRGMDSSSLSCLSKDVVVLGERKGAMSIVYKEKTVPGDRREILGNPATTPRSTPVRRDTSYPHEGCRRTDFH